MNTASFGWSVWYSSSHSTDFFISTSFKNALLINLSLSLLVHCLLICFQEKRVLISATQRTCPAASAEFNCPGSGWQAVLWRLLHTCLMVGGQKQRSHWMCDARLHSLRFRLFWLTNSHSLVALDSKAPSRGDAILERSIRPVSYDPLFGRSRFLVRKWIIRW